MKFLPLGAALLRSRLLCLLSLQHHLMRSAAARPLLEIW